MHDEAIEAEQALLAAHGKVLRAMMRAAAVPEQADAYAILRRISGDLDALHAYAREAVKQSLMADLRTLRGVSSVPGSNG